MLFLQDAITSVLVENTGAPLYFHCDTPRLVVLFLSALVFKFLAIKKNNHSLSLKTTKKVIYLFIFYYLHVTLLSCLANGIQLCKQRYNSLLVRFVIKVVFEFSFVIEMCSS